MFIAGVARPVPAAEAALGARLAAYLELTKPRVNALVVAVAAAGFWMGAPGIPDRARFAYTLLGVALLGAGMFTLNQCFEAVPDSRMRRTASRPVPSERLRPSQALWFGWTLAAAGLAVLLAGTNPASAIIGTLTLTSYLFIYTPLKLRTPHCTLVGAFPGAAPPLLGWVAARGYVSVEALWLFAILW